MPDPKPTTHVADWLAEDWGELQHDPTFVSEQLMIDVAVQIAEAMEEAGFDTQKELSEHLGISPSAVSQLLSGDQNVTINRLVSVALALEKGVRVELVDHSPPEVNALPTGTKRVIISEEASARNKDEQFQLWTGKPSEEKSEEPWDLRGSTNLLDAHSSAPASAGDPQIPSA